MESYVKGCLGPTQVCRTAEKTQNFQEPPERGERELNLISKCKAWAEYDLRHGDQGKIFGGSVTSTQSGKGMACLVKEWWW